MRGIRRADRCPVAGLLAGWLPLLVAVGSHAQPLVVADHHLSMKDGLSAPAVTALLHDRQGFLWIGTADGLNRYDGYDLEVFFTRGDTASLADNYINLQALYEDARGFLWIGTRGGLSRYDPYTKHFVNYRHDPAEHCSVPHDHVYAVTGDRHGTLWVGTGQGLARHDNDTGCFIAVPITGSTPGQRVQTLLGDHTGVLWIGTEDGLYRYDPSVRRAVPFGVRPRGVGTEAEQRLSRSNIYDLGEDPTGTLWIATFGDGLFRLDPTRKMNQAFEHDPDDPSSLPDNRLLTLHVDRQDRIWVGTYEDGLVRLDPMTGRVARRYTHRLDEPGGLASDQVTSIAEDASGALWIGTWRGVNRLASASSFQVYAAGTGPEGVLNDPEVRAVAQDEEGVLWVGTAAKGLTALDPATGTATTFTHDPKDAGSLSSNRVNSLWVDAQGPVWVGTSGGGLNRFDRRTRTFTHFVHDPNDPYSLSGNLLYSVYGDHTGTLWIGTIGQGLNRLEPSTARVTRFRHDPADPHSLGWDTVWPVLEDRTRLLWVGTMGGGLNRFDRRTERFTRFQYDPDDPGSLSHDRVVALSEDAAGRLWIGTMGGGLNRFDRRTERFIRYGVEDGLPHHNVACVLHDDAGRLWISTSDGLARFDPETERFRTYGAAHGLPGTTFFFSACHRATDGRLYFGSFQGLIAFHPDSLHDDPTPPPVVLTAFEVFNEPVPLDSAITHVREIRLPYDAHTVGFRFAALDFTAPEANAYAYRMEGLDAGWTQTDQRQATYRQLRPGRYVFRVKAANEAGVWNETGASVRLLITPPFWRTWWFAIAFVLLTLSLLTAAYRYRVHHLLHLERTRRRIADDLHDDIGGQMSSLALFLDFLGHEPRLDAAERLEVREHADSVRHLTQNLRDTVWVVDAGQDHLPALLERMRETARRTAPGRTVPFEAPAEVPAVRLGMTWRRNVFFIYKEALHNAQRHARAGRVEVAVRLDGEWLSVNVRDDGQGFDPEQMRPGRGLQTMQARAEELGGRLTIRSREGEGTRVELRVKLFR